jgi:hypothetical protein
MVLEVPHGHVEHHQTIFETRLFTIYGFFNLNSKIEKKKKNDEVNNNLIYKNKIKGTITLFWGGGGGGGGGGLKGDTKGK